MSAISWREQSTRRSAPSEHALAPNLRIIPWIGILCALALALYPHPLVWPAAFVGVACALVSLTRLTSFGSPVVTTGVALFSIATAIGAFAAGFTEPALVRLTGYAAALILAVALLPFVTSASGILRVAIGLGVAVAGAEFVVLALLRGSLPSSPFTRLLEPFTSLFSGFPGITGDTLDVNARFAVHQYGLAHLTLVAAPFGIALAMSRLSWRWRALGAAWALVNVVLLLATQTRGALLALAVVAAVLGSTRSRWAWTVIPGAAALLGLLIARGTISRQIESDWLESRLSIWGRTMHMLGDFPLTGVGLGARTYAETFAWYHAMPDPYAVSHTHNILLQAYAEQGLLGALSLAAIVIGGCVLAYRAIFKSSGPVWWAAAGAGGAFIGSALYGVTDQVVSSNLSLALLFALLAIVSRAAPEAAPSVAKVSPRGARLAWFGLLGAGGFAIVLIGLSLGTRWLSGLALNAGSLELTHAFARPGQSQETRQQAFRNAEGWLLQATTLNRLNIAAWRNLGWARTGRNDIPGAHSALDQAASSQGLNEFERYMLGRLYFQLGFTDQAIEQWREARDADRLRTVADALTARGRWRDAVSAHGALLALEPDNPDHMSNLAVAVLNSGGSLEEALRWFETATNLDPSAARSLSRQLVLRGEPFRINEGRGGGDAQKAIFWFSLASKVDPTYDRPEVEIGAVLMNRQRYAEAEQHFREALRREDSDSSLWSWVGESLEGQGRLVEAIEYYRAAVAKRPDRAVHHARLGNALAQAGQLTEAVTAYREAVRLAPEDPSISQELERLERLAAR